MIDVACSACGKNVLVKDEHAGKRIKCPGCGRAVSVPEPFPSIDTSEQVEPIAAAVGPEPERPPLREHIAAGFAGAWGAWKEGDRPGWSAAEFNVFLERFLLRCLLYLTMFVSFAAVANGGGKDGASAICASVALAGLAASSRGNSVVRR